jgi:hypothetical protein
MLYLQLIIFSVRDDNFVDSEVLFVTDFVHLKIKPAQSFKHAYKNMVYMYIFIGVIIHTCMNIYFILC